MSASLWRPIVLPDFPWDTIGAARARAHEHPGGIVDLSVGTPVDPTPEVGRSALMAASDSPGYPLTWGTPGVRAAASAYLATRWGAPVLAEESVLPVIGTKELVASLPTLLGMGPDDTMVIPRTAYPTYAVGAAMVGAQVLAADSPDEIPSGVSPRLIWINSPANPTGRIATAQQVKAWVKYARNKDCLLAADECYGEFGWDAEPVSVLRYDICEGATDNLLGVYSLSKRSNLAGYRAGFIAGDAGVVQTLLGIRKHLGLMVPTPVLAAMRSLLSDQDHVRVQRAKYLARRTRLRPALQHAGFRIDDSQGALYLWTTRGEPGRKSLDFLAELGILVAPGDFYGESGRQHVRVALTATDERIDAAVERLMAL